MIPEEDDPGPFFRLIISALDRAGVPYMLVGSFASSMHGPPRATHDIDVVFDPSPGGLSQFLTLLAEGDVYVDLGLAREEFRRHGQFNVIDLSSTWKADFIYSKPTAFGRTEFERRIPVIALDTPVFVATPEDTILAKLEWSKLGQSEQQLRDVRGIIEVQADRLDRRHIETWLDELGVRELWEHLKSQP